MSPIHETMHEPSIDLGFDDDDDFDPKEMKKKMFLTEQSLMIKDAEILQLKDQLKEKDRQIEEMQGNISMLFSMVYDMRAKLQKRLGNEFADAEEQEILKKKEAEQKAKQEEDLKRYFDTPAPPLATPEELLARKRRYLVLKNRNKNPDHPDSHAEHILVDVGTSGYDKMGNRSGILSWGYETDRKRWWVKRNLGKIEWYKEEKDFQSFTKGDLEELAKAPYMSNETGSGRGERFLERLKREARKGFRTFPHAEPYISKPKDVYEYGSKRRMKIVKWPATNKQKQIPLVRKIPEGALKDMLFWAYDPVMGNAEVTCKNDVTYRLIDTVDLLKVSRIDLEVLAKHQILCPEQYEPISKEWTQAVASCLILTGDGPGSLKKFSKHGQR
jgi:hypothetical protein